MIKSVRLTTAVVVLLLTMASVGAFPLQAQSDSPTCSNLPTAQTGLTSLSITSNGMERHFTLYVPTGYDPATPVPLVLSIHGFASNAEQQRSFSRWNEFAERDTFLAVFPSGTGFPLRWNSGDSDFADGSGFLGNRADDVAFVNEMLDTLEANFCVDTARIFATGLSNGGGMSNRLACELSERITAIGTVAGAYNAVPGGCNPVRPVPVIAFHGTEDPIVPYEGLVDAGLPVITEWAQGWAERNGCSDATEVSGDPVSSITYSDCEAGAEVVLYTIAGGGHSWAGGPPLPEFIVGTTSQDIDATAIMWTFFQRFSIS